MTILPEIIPERLKKFLGGMIGIVVAMAGVLGPIFGGLLTKYTSWRWIFWMKCAPH